MEESGNEIIDVVWDMETADPDDFVTLTYLISHPRVNLKAVTCTPGTRKQIGLIRWLLDKFDSQIPVGAFNINHPKECVSAWHYNVYGFIPESSDAEIGWKVLLQNCDEKTVLITGAPLKNLGAAIKNAPGNKPFTVRKWVCQGGFAGEGVVPEALQMEKFKGKTVCQTFNFNGDPNSAILALHCQEIGEIRLVSKNVCHQVSYTREIQELLVQKKEEIRETNPKKYLGLSIIEKGMDAYLQKNKQGKMLHDPLAATTALNQNVIDRWAQVEVFREKGRDGGWGCCLCENSKIFISVSYDRDLFIETFLES